MGHIHNDRVLTGTTLEGFESALSIKYINQFIQQNTIGTWKAIGLQGPAANHYISNLEKIKSALEGCLKIREKMIFYRSNSTHFPYEKVMTDLGDLMISEFKKKNALLMPGGWSAILRACNVI